MSTVERFRKKPVVIEAIHYRGPEDKQLVREFVTGPIDEVGAFDDYPEYQRGLHIETLEGWMHVSAGDWIIKGVRGEFYPCKPDIFEATYEPELSDASGGATP